jgi:hypothetical protein
MGALIAKELGNRSRDQTGKNHWEKALCPASRT